MTRLRKVMLEELQRRNFSEATTRAYIGAVERFARYFGKPPDKLGPEHIREWQAYLLHKRKLAVGTVVAQTAGLRFFFVRTLKRRLPPDSIPYPKYTHHRVPKVLSPEEVAQLIDAASNLQARAILMLRATQRTGLIAGGRLEVTTLDCTIKISELMLSYDCRPKSVKAASAYTLSPTESKVTTNGRAEDPFD